MGTHNGATAIPADMFQTNSFLTRSSFFGARPKARTNDRRTVYTKAPQAKVGLFFSTTSGNCEYCAEWIQSSFEPYGEITEPMDIADVAVSDLSSYDSLIVGAPTWHTGADEGRSGTAWDEAYGDIRSLDLSGKKVAVFGVGDSSAYGEYFCDAIEELHSAFRDTGAEMCGGNVLKMTTISPTVRLLLMVCLLVSLLMKTMKVTRVKNVQRTGASSSPTQASNSESPLLHVIQQPRATNCRL